MSGPGRFTAKEFGFLGLLAAITLINPLSIHFYLPALPTIRTDFAVSAATAQLSFSVSLMTLAVMTLVIGSLSDGLGRKPVLLGGISCFLAGALICGLAESVEVLIAGRIVQAAGAASGIVLARTIARDVFGLERLTKVIAYLTMAYVMGPLLAPPLGGALVDEFGWRMIFWFGAAGGAALIVFSFLLIPETRVAADRLRGAGQIFGAYLTLFSKPRFCCYVLQCGFVSGAFFATASASSFVMQDMLGRSTQEYGLYFMFFPIGYLIGNAIASRLSERVSIDGMVLVGSTLNFFSVAGLCIAILTLGPSPLAIFIPGFLITMSQGLSLPSAQSGAISIDKNLAGTASGIGVFMQMFFGALGSQLTGVFADGTTDPMLMIAAALTIAALAVALPLRVLR